MSSEPVRIVVVGSGGRLGSAVVRVLRQRGLPVVAYDRKAMDLTNPQQIRDHIATLNFDALVNCAAMTSLDDCEREPKLAKSANAEAAAQIAEICAQKEARMLQVSTDYVYDGQKPGLRYEADPVNPLGVYAITKREAEVSVLAAAQNHLVIRVSWIFGPDRPSFVDQLLEKAKSGAPLAAIADKFSTPTYSMDIAAAAADLLAVPDARGIYNVANRSAEDVSWFVLATTALEMANELGISVKTREVQSLKLTEMEGFLAVRPIYTASSPTKLEKTINRPMRDWRAALREYLQQYHA